MKIFSSLVILFFIFILLFIACIEKPNNPVAVINDMFPPAPQKPEATVGDRNIVLSWQMVKSSDIYQYYIFRKDSINREFKLIDSSQAKTFIDKFLDNRIDYFYQISAINLNGYQGPRSVPISASPGVYNVIINNGAQYTDSISVFLTFVAPANVSLIKICNDSFFNNVTWEPFISPKEWRFDVGDGIKKVYAKFQNGFGNETLTVIDSITLDTKAFINSVTENTGGAVKTIGDTIHFTIISNEINGFATINIGEEIEDIVLYDDGTYGDSIPYDGCYEVDYIITEYFTAIDALIIGNFVDQVGNVALPVAAAEPISIQSFPTPVSLFDPAVDGTSIYLSWTQNNDTDFSSYRIYRSKLPDLKSNLSAIAVITDRTTNYFRDEGLEYSESYYYRVYVYNESGQSIESNEVVGTTDPNTIPDKVFLAVPKLLDNRTLRLSWTQNNDDDFASYRIFRQESSPVNTNTAAIMIITTQTTTTYNDENLARDTEYFYRVFVYDKEGLCAGSEEVSGKTTP